MAVLFGVRTGTVFIRNYDYGIAKTMGAVYDQQTGSFSLPVPGVCAADGSSMVPIVFNNPEQVLKKKVFPIVHIDRPDFTPAMQRWHSISQLEYRVGAEGAAIISGVGPGNQVVTGYAAIEEKVQAMPFDIPYTIQILARFQKDANAILQNILRTFKPYCKLDVVDSLGQTRTYTTTIDGAINSVEEFGDISERVKGYAISLVVEGELDLSDPTVVPVATGFVESISRTK